MVARKNEIKTILLKIAIIVSVFSQMNPFATIARPLMYISWVLIVGVAVVTSRRCFYFSKFARLYTVCYLFFVVICLIRSFISNSYAFPNYVQIMTVPLIVTVAGDFYSRLEEKEIQSILQVYIVCAVIFAIWVQVTYFPSYSSWLQRVTYAFTQKNSAAQVWIAAILILLFLIEYKNYKWKILGYGTSAYLLLITGISQCRTALLALGIVIACLVLFLTKRKGFAVLIIIAIAVFLWNFSYTRAFIDQALFLNKYAGADLNTFSSGRIGTWTKAFNVFWESPIFGSGQYYVDCSYILILAESGLIGFVLIELVLGSKLIQNFRYKGDKNKRNFLFCASVFYVVESTLEGYPPFGPGVSSFMFWLLSAIYLGQDGCRLGE